MPTTKRGLGVIFLGAGAVLVAAGVGYAVTRPKSLRGTLPARPRALPENPQLPVSPVPPISRPQDDQEAANPASPDKLAPGQADPHVLVPAQVDYDGPAFSAIEETQPGTIESHKLLTALLAQYPTETAAAITRYKAVLAAFLAARQAEGMLTAERAQVANNVVATIGAGDSFAGAVAGIPYVGQVYAGIWKIIRMFAELDAEGKAAGKKGWYGGFVIEPGDPYTLGYKDQSFYFRDVPILSMTAPIWVEQFARMSNAWGPALAAFHALCVYRPLGYPVNRISIENDGSYTYELNMPTGERRTMMVWSPADISTKGPRGFDPAAPFAWKVPGLKMAWADIPFMRPIPWAGAYWTAYLVALQSPAAGNQLMRNNPQNVELLNGALDGLNRLAPRDPNGYRPAPGEIPPGVIVPGLL